MDLFDHMREMAKETEAPLASRLRPRTLDEVVGQQHIVGKDKLLYRAIKADKLGSIIFYGPPGTGKTTLAKVIANTTSAEFKQLNATVAGKKDMEAVVKEAQDALGMYGRKTILFVDEIHRFNKSQQDYLLPFVEDGTLILIGATTENPYFEVNGALLSRSRIFELKPLDKEDIKTLIGRAVYDKERGMGAYEGLISEDAAEFLADVANGDARAALNAVELGLLTTERSADGKIHIDLEVAQECIQKRAVRYDKDGDNHYDTISAFIKSMRGSDPDAAVYYLARMLYAGEDVKFIARRIMICASEDVGNADPQALAVAVNASLAVERIPRRSAWRWPLPRRWRGSGCRRPRSSSPRPPPMWPQRLRAMRPARRSFPLMRRCAPGGRRRCRPICRTAITRVPRSWEEGWDISTPTTSRVTMWSSSTCRTAWWGPHFMSPRTMATRSRSKPIWRI